MEKALHVAVGVVRDGAGNILLTQRAKHVHQGGLWEFPGGKLEQHENVVDALRRELREEVGIEIQSARPLIKIRHRYPDLPVLLDVWQVNDFSGVAEPHEGQAMCWVNPERLYNYAFPAANLPIISASRLPDRYAILEGASIEQVLHNLHKIIENNVRLLQLRIKSLPRCDVHAAYEHVSNQCQKHNISLLLNSDLDLPAAKADGIHLSSRALMSCHSRPADYEWVAASCHNETELQHAQQIGVDFVVLAPILPTATHPNVAPLGWQNMAMLIERVNLPVFALGGLTLTDIDRVIQAGGQGIAGISAFL